MNSYIRGGFYRICDLSGFKVRGFNTAKQWNGLWVDRRFYEPRNPQDFVRGRRDVQTVKDARPEAPDVFLSPGDVTPDDL